MVICCFDWLVNVPKKHYIKLQVSLSHHVKVDIDSNYQEIQFKGKGLHDG